MVVFSPDDTLRCAAASSYDAELTALLSAIQWFATAMPNATTLSYVLLASRQRSAWPIPMKNSSSARLKCPPRTIMQAVASMFRLHNNHFSQGGFTYRRKEFNAHYVISDSHIMNIIFDLPTEVLAEIVCQCDNPAVSETCKTFSAVAHSISSLWTTVILRPRQFTIDGPDFLRARILRTKGAMLTVCIRLTERTKEVLALCKLLAEYNA